MELSGKITVITGASSGIGAATARAAAQEGAKVVLLARTQSKLEQVAQDIRQGGGVAHVYPVDLTNADAVGQTVERITAEIGTPDIVFNNAGSGKWLSVEETAPDEAVKMMASPYFAAFFVTRAFLPGMLKRNSGYIINMTSAASRLVWPRATAYIAARWAVHGFTEALRADLTGTGIHVMLATFAKVATPYWANNPGSEERLPKAQSLIRVLMPEEAAQAIIDGIKRDKRVVASPFMLRCVFALNHFFPAITQRIMTSSGHRARRTEMEGKRKS